ASPLLPHTPSVQPSPAHRALLSFPTRRSSDLHFLDAPGPTTRIPKMLTPNPIGYAKPCSLIWTQAGRCPPASRIRAHRHLRNHRSEEHTSELQSRFDLVCRLLLEKKQKNVDTR